MGSPETAARLMTPADEDAAAGVASQVTRNGRTAAIGSAVIPALVKVEAVAGEQP